MESRHPKPSDTESESGVSPRRKTTMTCKILTYIKRIVLFILVSIILLFAIIPIVFKYSPTLRHALVFGYYVQISMDSIRNPEPYIQNCGRDLSIVNGNITYKGWHIMPNCPLNATSSRLKEKSFRQDNRPIVIYYHGNSDSRAYKTRIYLYKQLASRLNYHVVAFDYAGFADSTFVDPTKETVAEDALFMYKWLLNQEGVKPQRITVWGHSIGTAIVTRLVASVANETKPNSLILESGFDTLVNVISNHPALLPFRYVPIFKYFFIVPVETSSDINFDSTLYIEKLHKVRILMLHAEDDFVIMFSSAQNLYKLALEKYGHKQVKLYSTDSEKSLGHLFLAEDEGVVMTVKNFIEAKTER